MKGLDIVLVSLAHIMNEGMPERGMDYSAILGHTILGRYLKIRGFFGRSLRVINIVLFCSIPTNSTVTLKSM